MNFTSSEPLLLSLILCSLFFSHSLQRPGQMFVTVLETSCIRNASGYKIHLWWLKQIRLCNQKSGGELLLAVNRQLNNDLSGCCLCTSLGLSFILIFSDMQESCPSSGNGIWGQVREEEGLQPWPCPLLGKGKAFQETLAKFCLCFLVAGVSSKASVFNS